MTSPAIQAADNAHFAVKALVESLERQLANYDKTNKRQADKILELEKKLADDNAAHELTAARLVSVQDKNTNVVAGLTKDVADLRALNAEKFDTIAQMQRTIDSVTACNKRQEYLLQAIDKLHPGCLVAAHICIQHGPVEADRVTATQANTMRSELEDARRHRDYHYNEILRLRAALRKLHQVIMDTRKAE
jgi:hypothetical protein